jgi:hypothetical protein
MSYDLTGNTVSNTYGRVVQVVHGVVDTYYDGFGNLLDLGPGTVSVGPMGPTGTTGPIGPTGSQGQSIYWAGSWDNMMLYSYYDVVSYNSNTYICIQSLVPGPMYSSPDLDSIHWQLMVLGITGSSGTSGIDGTSGTSGESGTSGTSGESGTSGTSGENGTSGTSGESGTSGTSGESGTSGTSGESGTSGTSGENGTSGTSGESGTSGTSGENGTSGTSGESGTSGTSGATGPQGPTGSSGFHSVNLVTSASYSIVLNDVPTQYFGISHSSTSVNITIPDYTSDGKVVIVKDESGNASIFPITVNASKIDQSNQAIIALDNGSITMMWRVNNWWII